MGFASSAAQRRIVSSGTNFYKSSEVVLLSTSNGGIYGCGAWDECGGGSGGFVSGDALGVLVEPPPGGSSDAEQQYTTVLYFRNGVGFRRVRVRRGGGEECWNMIAICSDREDYRIGFEFEVDVSDETTHTHNNVK